MSNIIAPFYTPVGTVYPVIPKPPPVTTDARTSALKVLREYISELTFYKPGINNSNQNISFQIPFDQIHIDQPDNETSEVYPTIVFEPGNVELWYSGYFDEQSMDEFGKGTVLFVHGEQIEHITVRIKTMFRADRRAVMAGLERALSPFEQIWGGMRLFCGSDYYNQTPGFFIDTTRVIDGPESANNRREATISLSMHVQIVELVNYKAIIPLTPTTTDGDP